MAVTELEVHPDAIICEECGHDCDRMDCGDVCICVEEYDDEPEFYDDFDYRLEYDSDGYGDY